MSVLLLAIRRGSIVLIIFLGYTYFRLLGEHYSLVSIGLTSFAAVAQFAPAILGGIFWKAGTKSGAVAGLLSGFAVWGYTLVIPSLAEAGFLPAGILADGPFGCWWLHPYRLFGLQGLDHIGHAVFWSMLINFGVYGGVSLFSHPSAIEHSQAAMFVDVFKRTAAGEASSIWRGSASVPDLRSMLRRFLGRKRTDEALARYARSRNIDWAQELTAGSELVAYAETLLAGAIGSASARVMVASIEKEEPLGIEEVMDILNETRQVIAYSRKLERATSELKAANERLQELDRLKDEFISTVTHELRTPLTSVKSIAEILHQHPDLDPERHRSFTEIIIKESERLTRLIRQVLDFQRIESGRMEWQISRVDIRTVVRDALAATRQLVEEKNIEVATDLPDTVPMISGDRDRLVQVMVNLLSNAVKFCESDSGKIRVRAEADGNGLRVDVQDNGIGISEADQRIIFDEFRQVRDTPMGRPRGTGLGLTITKRIIETHQGRIWVRSTPGQGATFSFHLPAGESVPTA